MKQCHGKMTGERGGKACWFGADDLGIEVQPQKKGPNVTADPSNQ